MKPLTKIFAGSVSLTLLLASVLRAAETPPSLKNPKPLFDGTTLAGWEGNPKILRVEDGCLTGGSYVETMKFV